MFHGLNNDFLYTAFKIDCTFEDSSGSQVSISGTAFFINVSQKAHLITNRHNLDAVYKDKKYANYRLRSISLTGRFSGDTLNTCSVPLEHNEILYSKNDLNDIACIPNTKINKDGGVTINYIINQQMIALRDDFNSKFSVCDFVAFPGYPQWYDQVDKRPIFRVGTIASDPRKDYHYTELAGECIAYEAFSYSGSSGSPVFALQKGPKPGHGIQFDGFRECLLIGINGGHLPSSGSSHSGISYFYKSSAILDIIQQYEANLTAA